MLPPTGPVVAALAAGLVAMSQTRFPDMLLAPEVTQSMANMADQPTMLDSVPEMTTDDTPDLDAVIWERPLFAEGRRAPEQVPEVVELIETPVIVEPQAEVVVAPELPSTPPSLELRGFMKQGEITRALVVIVATGEEVWVEEGYILEGWMLTKISQDAIQMEMGNNEVSIQLYQ